MNIRDLWLREAGYSICVEQKLSSTKKTCIYCQENVLVVEFKSIRHVFEDGKEIFLAEKEDTIEEIQKMAKLFVATYVACPNCMQYRGPSI